ncbi:MAG: hypothetical protein ACRD1L_12760, partial [Terriglobales bacterium]
PMVILAALSIVAGMFNLPAALGGGAMLQRFLAPVLPALARLHATGLGEAGSEGVAAIIFIVGVYLVFLFYLQRPKLSGALMRGKLSLGVQRYWLSDWGMDWLYDRVLVRPVIGAAQADRNDAADWPFEGAGRLSGRLWRLLTRTESGRMRWYAGWATAGAIVLLAIVMWRG